mmetsp:Transcript_8839/g.24941  ORF Transcript_8839/g.24941 Transcript_8839/m.24941 type:complete len:399 (-) Transcript_8839:76-1272(-)
MSRVRLARNRAPLGERKAERRGGRRRRRRRRRARLGPSEKPSGSLPELSASRARPVALRRDGAPPQAQRQRRGHARQARRACDQPHRRRSGAAGQRVRGGEAGLLAPGRSPRPARQLRRRSGLRFGGGLRGPHGRPREGRFRAGVDPPRGRGQQDPLLRAGVCVRDLEVGQERPRHGHAGEVLRELGPDAVGDLVDLLHALTRQLTSRGLGLLGDVRVDADQEPQGLAGASAGRHCEPVEVEQVEEELPGLALVSEDPGPRATRAARLPEVHDSFQVVRATVIENPAALAQHLHAAMARHRLELLGHRYQRNVEVPRVRHGDAEVPVGHGRGHHGLVDAALLRHPARQRVDLKALAAEEVGRRQLLERKSSRCLGDLPGRGLRGLGVDLLLVRGAGID